jgi:hypothetical protein
MPSQITAAAHAKVAALKPIPSAVHVDEFFKGRAGTGCVKWFNKTLADKGPWKGVKLVDTPDNDVRFHQFWNRSSAIFGCDTTPMQFICLMSIFANEVRGNFTPATERMGVAGHPGMAYLFDRIEGKKRSYNTLPTNKTAFDCFNHPSFIAAHSTRPLAARLRRTTDRRWVGDAWPADFPTDPDPAVTGFICQADFVKFRGRGFIQTTGRDNYVPLIDFVKAYRGDNSTIDYHRHTWGAKTAGEIAYETTNEDWDRLFRDTDLIVAAEAIRVHSAASGNYLRLGADAATLDGTGPGSVYYMGLRIGGSQGYAGLFKERVAAVLGAV